MKDPVEFLDSVYLPDTPGFLFRKGGAETLLSTCFGVQLLYLLNRRDRYDEGGLGERLLSMQQADGLFVPLGWHRKDMVGRHSQEYFLWQTTFFSLTALDMLGFVPKYPLSFLSNVSDNKSLMDWLRKRDWKDFWYSSNEIMFLLYFFIYCAERLDVPEYKFFELTLLVLDYLDGSQDAITGYWGDECGSNPLNGLFGAAHVMLFYDYFNRKPPSSSAMLQTTLDLQLPNGFYGNNFGGACEDYDAIEIIVRTAAENLQSNKVRNCMNRMRQTLLKAQCPNGGFSYQIAGLSLKSLLHKVLLKYKKQDVYRYSGWGKMVSNVFEADLWATYFRTLTIALIDDSLNMADFGAYVFYDLPGWGYHRPRQVTGE